MRSTFSIWASAGLLLLAGTFSGSAAAQGINIRLRANANPFPVHDRYANVWGDGNFAYVGSYFSNTRNQIVIRPPVKVVGNPKKILVGTASSDSTL